MRKRRNRQHEIEVKIAAVDAIIDHAISAANSPAVNVKTISRARLTVAGRRRIRNAAGRRANQTAGQIIDKKGRLKDPKEVPEAKAAISRTNVIHVNDAITAKVAVVVTSVRTGIIEKIKRLKAMRARNTSKAVKARVVSVVLENADHETTPSADVARAQKMTLAKSLKTLMGTQPQLRQQSASSSVHPMLPPRRQ
jgi:hypothetical protein